MRQQLPVGVGPDDRMPSGSREPKRAQQKTARNGDSVTEHHTVVNAKIIGRFGDADDFLDCFIIPARIVGGTFWD